MTAPVAFFDPELDPALFERATRAAGMALEKHLPHRDRPRRPEEPYAQARLALTRWLGRPRLSPPIHAAVLHEPEPGAVRSLVASARERVWIEPRTRRAELAPPWPGCERIASGAPELVAHRLPAELDPSAILARLAGPDRQDLYLLGEPRAMPLASDPTAPHDLGWLVAWVRSARWVLTSHAVWPTWVPYCVYSEQDPRTLPGLERPEIVWISSPRAPEAPRLPGSDDPAFEQVADASELRRAERIDLTGTRVVSLSALTRHAHLRDLLVADCPYVHRDELGGLARLERLDLSGVPMRDLEPLRGLPQLHTLRTDLRPREGWAALRALPGLRCLDLDGICELDPGELSEHARVRALRIRRGDRSSPSASPRSSPWPVGALAGAQGLEALAVEADDADLSALAALPGLRALWLLGGRTAAEDALAGLGALALTGLALELRSPGELPRLGSLRRLAVAVEELGGLERLPLLEHLALCYQGDSAPAPGALDALGAQSALESLRLSDVDEVPLEVLQRLPRLRALGLSGTPIDLAALAQLPALRAFETSAPSLDLAGLAHHPSLESIVLHGATRLERPEALLSLPALRRFVTRRRVLPEPLALALEARGVVVATHPVGWRVVVHDDLPLA